MESRNYKYMPNGFDLYINLHINHNNKAFLIGIYLISSFLLSVPTKKETTKLEINQQIINVYAKWFSDYLNSLEIAFKIK